MLQRHSETFMEIEELGKLHPEYRANFHFNGEFINSSHEQLNNYALDGVITEIKGIKGSLRLADALKLYEMAYFSKGDILELGTFEGLSASIMARAIIDAQRPGKIISVDIGWRTLRKASSNLKKVNLSERVELMRGDASSAIKKLNRRDRKFSFAFVDHSHAYRPVFDTCQLLHRVLEKGAFCLFHDFNDRRNGQTDNDDYDVYRAVKEGLSEADFKFFGIYGCTALYRYCPGEEVEK